MLAMETVYVAKRVLESGGRTYAPGDVIPDAASWPSLSRHISLGWIERVFVRSQAEPQERAAQQQVAPHQLAKQRR